MAARLISDPALRLHFIGGRFSGYLAGMLWQHLRQLRADCHMVSGNRPDRIDSLIDIGRRDLIIAFDYRRYQSQALRVASAAKARNARVVLFTDIYASPLRELADLIISAPVESASPFDTMVPALAQVEALIACLTLRTENLADRLEGIDALRNDFNTHLLEDK